MSASVPYSAPALATPTPTAAGRKPVAGAACRPTVTALILAGSDLVALALAAAACVYVRHYFHGQYEPVIYFRLWPVLGLFLLGFAALRLYSAPVSPPEELRHTFLVVSVVYLALGTVTFMLRGAETYSRSVFLAAWFLSILMVLGQRALVRAALAQFSWWGRGVVILGAGRTGRRLIKLLRRRPGMGLKPVAIFDDRPHRRAQFAGVPILGPLALAPALGRAHGRLLAVAALSDMHGSVVPAQLLREQQTFRSVILIPDLGGISSLGVATQDLGGMLGLEIHQRLLDPGRLALKRALDLVLILLASPLLLPLFAVLALLIKLDSKGHVFFGQRRIGRGGREFTAWKFRTMVHRADEALPACLGRHPDLRGEWERCHKLACDPRMTRIGRYLRRMSLDELPQVWNVVRGQMSLVGPRPIIRQEVSRYAEHFDLYTRVRPGITGLWQVSGRNDLSYAERIRLDVYYVQNWSLWLDLHLLASTVRAVATTRGAY
jgi:Undecaprenyl-phosphate galactose phosphotransferase WbaP